ncbi:hypothetical protein TeGR_g7501 [Tetraparma gracilis]|uniref:ABM domain-containing protein n=1 Tax=Tetraparma gracilis TaxID=2962635 RepID=A0ABQ6MFD4_9STRA|nr:hypothetical protein TeGR_g7501 [Tetraparma gracilis]
MLSFLAREQTPGLLLPIPLLSAAASAASLLHVAPAGGFLPSEPVAQATLASLALLHLASAPVAYKLAQLKGLAEPGHYIGVALLQGPLLLPNLSLMPDEEERRVMAVEALPPLSTPLSSLELREDGIAPDCLVLTFSIRAAAGKQYKMRTILEEFSKSAAASPGTLSSVANQDPEDNQNFMLLQRFRSSDAMRKFQNELEFKLFTAQMEPLLEEPMGLYACNERNGVMGMPVHPMGPGGEGGREDAIYSSPTNIQGSGTGM